VILLPATLLRRIAIVAEEAYPEECCGLLIGFRDPSGRACITEIAESGNMAPPPRRDRFEVDPAVRFAVMRRLRGSHLEIVGHYHSHPHAPAVPSQQDTAMAYEPELLCLIITVHGGAAGELGVFRYDPLISQFARVPITSVD
jgi:proteasome lid subunit RPN8/RPN11